MLELFLQKVAKTQEMLTMLIFGLFDPLNFPETLNVFTISPVLGTFDKKHLTFPCFVTLWSQKPGNVKYFFQKGLKQERCWICYLFCFSTPLISLKTFNICNITPVLCRCLAYPLP